MKIEKHHLGKVIFVLCTIITIIQAASATPEIYIRPTEINASQGDNITVEVFVKPIDIQIMGAKYKISFNNSVLKALSQDQGEFLSPVSDNTETLILFNEICNPEGRIEYGEMRINTETGVIMEGKIAQIKFEVRCSGISELQLYDVILSNPGAQEIANITIYNATINVNQELCCPFLIIGNITTDDGSDCNDPVVTVTNLNTSKQWTARTIEGLNCYQLRLKSCADIVEGEILQFNVLNQKENQSKLVEHIVTIADVNSGGLLLDIQLSKTTANNTIPAKISISPATVDVDVNDTIILPVTIANATDIRQISFDIVFDPGVVTVLNITANDSIPSSNLSCILDTGKVTIELTNSEHVTVTNTTSLIDITILAGEDVGTTALDLQNVEMVDDTGSHVPDTIINGSITVCVKGDFNYNDRVDIGDVAKVAFMVAEKVAKDPRADFNNNGRVDVGDAAKISFYLAEKVDKL